MEIPVTVIDEAPFKEGLLIQIIPEVRCGVVVLEDGTIRVLKFEDLKSHWTYDPEEKRWRSDITSEAGLIEAMTQEIEDLYAYTRELEEAAVPQDPEAEDEDDFS